MLVSLRRLSACWTCCVVLLAACVESGGSSNQPQHSGSTLASLDSQTAFRDSQIGISIRGNDGSTPGDVLQVGQSSRLIGWVLAVERAPDSQYRGMAREVAGARIRWRSLAPRIIQVDSRGLVRALSVGRAIVEATAVFDLGTTSSAVRDSMSFTVLTPDSFLSQLRVTAVSAPGTNGAYQTCVVTQGGTVACWRPVVRLSGGEVTPSTASHPIQTFEPPTGTHFRSVVTGIQHVCALTDTERAYCWGDNEWGQLGIGGEDDKTEPSAVAAAIAFTKLSAGRTHTCGITVAGELLCWGEGTNNALGPAGTDRCTIMVERQPHRPEPYPTPCARTPKPVQLPDLAADVALGDDHTCALTARGEVYCWGSVYNIDFDSRRPTRIDDGGARLVQIASGSRHVCGLDAEGRAYCWGRNWDGQLEQSVPREGSAKLVQVGGSLRFRSITGGDDHTCGIAQDGSAYCWGRGSDGQLGNGTSLKDVGRPTLVVGRHVWRTIATGYSHSCAITDRGALYCWGSGLAFRSEPGSYHEQPEPFLVAGWR